MTPLSAHSGKSLVYWCVTGKCHSYLIQMFQIVPLMSLEISIQEPPTHLAVLSLHLLKTKFCCHKKSVCVFVFSESVSTNNKARLHKFMVSALNGLERN